MKKLLGLFAVGSTLFLGAVAQAQPATPPAGGVTVVTETTTGGMEQPASMMVDAPTGTMPATGGAPIAMALSGILMAGGAFFARRKLS